MATLPNPDPKIKSVIENSYAKEKERLEQQAPTNTANEPEPDLADTDMATETADTNIQDLADTDMVLNADFETDFETETDPEPITKTIETIETKTVTPHTSVADDIETATKEIITPLLVILFIAVLINIAFYFYNSIKDN